MVDPPRTDPPPPGPSSHAALDPAPGRRARAAWDAVAPSYAAARRRPWPMVEEALRSLPAGARVLDVGTGSGRHALAAADMGLDALAVDAAKGFLRRADPMLRGRLVQATAAELPVRDRAADAVLLVAVLGTIPDEEDRVDALREARRVLRPGGLLLATVWARWQPKYLRALAGQGPWTRTGPGEVLAPWAGGEAAGGVDRPYYLYTRRALRAELRYAGWGDEARVEPMAMAAGPWHDNLVVRARR